MTSTIEFFDDIRVVLIADADTRTPARAILELPHGNVECLLLPADGRLPLLTPTFEHRVMHDVAHGTRTEVPRIAADWAWCALAAMAGAVFVAIAAVAIPIAVLAARL